MSFARFRNYSQSINTNPKFVFTYPGSQGTGVNNLTWGLELFQDNKTEDLNGNKLDNIDHWPKAGEFAVFLNGVLQIPTVDYTITQHDSGNKFSFAFNGGAVVGDNDYVTIIL